MRVTFTYTVAVALLFAIVIASFTLPSTIFSVEVAVNLPSAYLTLVILVAVSSTIDAETVVPLAEKVIRSRDMNFWDFCCL